MSLSEAEVFYILNLIPLVFIGTLHTLTVLANLFIVL